MGVLISNNQNNQEIFPEKIRKTAQAILDALECPEGELSILVVDDPRIAELNKEYLDRDGPTNVIAFPMREGHFPEIGPNLLGDVVISTDTARREGEISGISTEERIIQLLVHGVLHLFGYDHENDDGRSLEMEKKNDEILDIIG